MKDDILLHRVYFNCRLQPYWRNYESDNNECESMLKYR